MKFEESVFIKSPVKQVFKFLSNYRSHKQFNGLYKETKHISEGKMQKGSELFSKIFFLGRKIETNSEVTEFEPEKALRFISKNGPVPSDTRYELSPEGEGTRVNLQFDIEPGSYFRLGETFLKPRLGKEMEDSLQSLKKILEAKAMKESSKSR